jgi:hypothetical protein
VKWYHFCEGQCAPSPRWAAKGQCAPSTQACRHTSLPPTGPHNDILCRNRRRHNNCSNIRRRRREDTTKDPKRER